MVFVEDPTQPPTARRPNEQAIEQLIAEEQVRIGVQQVRKVAIPHLLVDLSVLWIGLRIGLGAFAVACFVVITATQLTRSIHLPLLARRGILTNGRLLQRLQRWLVAIALIRSVIIVGVMTRPITPEHYVLTMILVGNAAAAVSAVAGNVRNYIHWSIPFAAPMIGGWLWRGGLDGILISLLILLLLFTMARYVRDQGDAIRRIVESSEWLRLEKERAEQAHHQAQSANEAKTRFFAAASHDLRQPLHALASYCAAMAVLTRRMENPAIDKANAGIQRALQESRGLLDSLLEISQLDAGAIKVEWADIDLRGLLEHTESTAQPLADKKGLVLTVAAGPGLVARADQDILLRIVQNLVGNALKFTQQGQVELSARRVAGPAGARTLEICVSDTGPGIAEDEQDRVFEEFYQLDNPERDRRKGLGLGLAIVRRHVQLIDAQITLHSRAGQGTRFTLTLHESLATRPLPPPATDIQETEARRPAGGRSLLVIDDEEEVRQALRLVLEHLDWRVDSASDLAQALALWESGSRPDALVLDFRLAREESGLAVLAALRAQGCTAPALLVTGDTAPDRIAQAREAGVEVAYKPIDGVALAARLEGLLVAPAVQGQRIV